VIDGYPAKAMWVQEFSNFFIPEVDRRRPPRHQPGHADRAARSEPIGDLAKTNSLS
jgi:hypothetical protein